MPVNSFEEYPMNWKPDKERLKHPYYLSLAEQLEHDIKKGKLQENCKLPPQRELADYLDINLSTITRAYKLCQKRGLIYAAVGKGTFVSPHIGVQTTVVNYKDETAIEMGMVFPFDEDNCIVREVASELLAKPSAEQYFDYSFPLGSPFQKNMMKKWLEEFGCSVDTDHILITAGGQNALSIVLASLFSAGDKIAADPYTYANFIGLANMLNIELIPIKSDELGINPGELEKVCRLINIKGIYLMPAWSNPTNQCMDAKRRSELAKVIMEQDMIVLEDDSYAILSDERIPPLATLVPDRTIYLNGFSKPISAGLRVAALAFPEKFKVLLERGLFNLNLKTPSLNIEIAAELIRSGVYREILQKKRERAVCRNQHYQEIMGAFPHIIHPRSFFQWFPIPRNCTGRAFEAMMAVQGVRVYGSERFALGDTENNHFIRIATSSPPDENTLRQGLQIIKAGYLELSQKDTMLIV